MAAENYPDATSEVSTAVTHDVGALQSIAGRVTLFEALAVDTDPAEIGASMSNHSSEAPDYDDQ